MKILKASLTSISFELKLLYYSERKQHDNGCNIYNIKTFANEIPIQEIFKKRNTMAAFYYIPLMCFKIF